MYWQEEQECRPRKELEQLQLERLRATLRRVGKTVPFYKSKFAEKHCDPEQLNTLEQLRSYPFTLKQDLRDNYPYGLFAVPLRDIVRVHSSSGTTGMATVVGYNKNDIVTWSNLVARILCGAGVTANDVIQIAFGYGLFTGGFGLHYGAECLGASVIPISAGNTKRQIQIMQDFKSTALVCTPSYALKMADVMMDMGVNPNGLSLRYGLFGGEPWSEAMRREINERLGIHATDNYGLSEVLGPGIAGECSECDGLHVNEDHFYVEILDPDTLEPVAPGEVGELVITTLTKEAFPVIRYRTRDLTRLLTEPCPCGRSFHRISRLMGRSDDMLIIKGVNVFPTQIESILFDIEGTEPHYRLIVERENNVDKLTIQVEVVESIFFDAMKQQRIFVDAIRKRMASELGVGVNIQLVEERTLERFNGKGARILDKREL
ncbi:MAG: phenylacetate--CoA ligase [Deltaproteobacteria bacterium]|nr:MAG: phenylacetate--CoA ligase [Deltaproteobacteria bacterium]